MLAKDGLVVWPVHWVAVIQRPYTSDKRRV